MKWKRNATLAFIVISAIAIITSFSVMAMVIIQGNDKSEDLTAPAPTTTTSPTPTPTSEVVLPRSPVLQTKKKTTTPKPIKPTTIQTHTQVKKTPTATPRNNSGVYPLDEVDMNSIKNGGLKPGTHILVLKEKTDNKVISDSCTVAFSLPMKNGSYSAVTAGHCGNVGQEIYSVPTDQYFDSAKKLGVISYMSSPADNPNDGDWSLIRITENVPHPANHSHVPQAIDMNEVKNNTRLCKDGSKTGLSCGEKQESGVKVNLGGFDSPGRKSNTKVTGIMDRIELCSLPGDSGSPVYDTRGIVGVLSSSSATDEDIAHGKCASESYTYYTPITTVIEQIKKKNIDIDFP